MDPGWRRALGLLLAVVAGFFILKGCGRIGIDKRDEHGMTSLMRAAQSGNRAEAERLIARGANVNARVPTRDLRELIAFMSWMQSLPKSDIGYTPLLYAVEGGHVDVARLLVSKGADVNQSARGTYNPLMMAVYRSNVEMMKLLAENGARIENRYLSMAIVHGSPSAVRFLLEQGANPNGSYPVTPDPKQPGPKPVAVIIMAGQRGDPEILRLLIEHGADLKVRDQNGWSALRWAKSAKKMEAAKVLEDAGLRDDFADDEALIKALWAKDDAAVAAILERGANANARDGRGVSALIIAARNGEVGSVEALLRKGADANHASPYNATPLITAAENGNVQIIARLLAAGADVRHRERIEQTALYQAVSHKHEDAARSLLEGGADPNDGSLALAALGGNMAILKLLLEKGAQPGRDGRHLLSEAARGGRNEAVLLLLEQGADPRGGEGDMTPLHYAAANCDAAAVKAMLAKGANPNARDLSGDTPLVFAAVNGKLENTHVLIAGGAKVDAKNEDGKTILDHARNHPDVADALRRAGAR